MRPERRARILAAMSKLRTLATAALVTGLLAAAGPGTAAAAGPEAYCVAGAASPPCPATFDAGHTFTTIGGAAAKVKTDGMAAITGDTVMIEPGTYTEAVVLQGQTGVTLFGDPAHAERPLITWDGAGGDTTFVVTGADGLTMRHLELKATEPAGTRAALFSDNALTVEDVHLASTGEALEVDNHDATLTNVVADSLPGGVSPLVNLQGQESSTVHTIHNLTVNAADRGYGMFLFGRTATIDGLAVTALAPGMTPPGPLPPAALFASVSGSLTLTHARLAGSGTGLVLYGGAVTGGGTGTLSDSLITASGPNGNDAALTAIGAGTSAVLAFAGTYALSNVTAIAAPADGVGVGVGQAAQAGGLPAAAVTVTNSIARGGARDITAFPALPVTGPAGTVVVDHTNYRPAAADGVSVGAGNQAGDPLFVNGTLGAAQDFHVQAGSPTLQAGAAVPAGATDLEGHARPDGAGTAPDLGAYESALLPAGPPPPPVVKQDPPKPPPVRDRIAPTLSHLSLTNTRFKVGRAATAVKARSFFRAIKAKRRPAARTGTILRFSLSEKAALSITISRITTLGRKPGSKKPPRVVVKKVGTLARANGRFGTNLVAFSGRIGKQRLAVGRYRLAITATDAAGNRSEQKTTTFTIVAR
jgi:hypothetical protein